MTVKESYCDANGNEWIVFKDQAGNNIHTMKFEESEHLNTPRHSLEDLGNIERITNGTEKVLENAIEHGQPSSRVIETDRGTKGVVDASVPGGSIEAIFNGVDQAADLEDINIVLEKGNDGLSHIDVRQSTYIADIQGQLRVVMGLLEHSKLMNARLLQSKIPRE